MTRFKLTRTLRRSYFILGLVLVVAFIARLSEHIPGLAGSGLEQVLKDIYDYLKDMALVLVTVIAAYLANVFQKRSKFVENLEQEWRGIVATKTALTGYFDRPYPSVDDYVAAYSRISETIDNMRIVYRNAGETDKLVGLYPYAPLHDMRRALQWLDPRRRPNTTGAERKLAQDAIQQSFHALRENFLEELDLEEPRHPLLISGGRRLKRPGATRGAKGEQERQRKKQDREPQPRPDIDTLLAHLYYDEQQADGRNGNGNDSPAQARGVDV
ncbi:MAG: hypothetical protein AB7U75_18025 [Hyphomicrobiaceae bacterium]